MKKYKSIFKFMSIFLTMELFLSANIGKSVNVQAASSEESGIDIQENDDFEYSITSGGIALLGYKGNSQDVVIPDEIDGKSVYMISSDLFEGKKEQIKTVTLGTLGGYYFGIFDGLINLENIYVNENNKLYTSVDGVLYDKDKITLYRYPAGRKDKEYTILDGAKSIDYTAFYDAHLQKIYVPNTMGSEINIKLDENTEIIRAYSVSDISFSSDNNFAQGQVVNICIKGANLLNNTIEGLVANIKIQGEDGFTKEINGIKVDKEGNANTSFIFPKSQKYIITANFNDKLGKCQYYSKDIHIKSNDIDTNISIMPQESSINKEIKLSCHYGNNNLYSFLVEHNNKTEVIKDFSKDNSCVWIPKEGGVYSVYVDIKLENGNIIRRTINNQYIVPYGEYSLDDIKKDMYSAMINNKIFNVDKYISGLSSLDQEAKEFLNILSYNICFDNDVIMENDYLRVSYNNKIYRINLPYSHEEILLNKKVNNFRNKYITNNMTELEKELAVVKYLKDNCEYDNDAVNWMNGGSLEDEDSEYGYETSYTAYGALVNGLATCKGYSEAAKVLLNSANIECSIVNSINLNHVWNIVKIDGEYYQLDVTWIDTTSNGTDNDFFNFSNLDTRHYSDDISNMDLYNKCTSIKYDDFVIANYNPYLRKMVNFNDNCFNTTDVYGNNYKFLLYNNEAICYNSVKFSTGKLVGQYSIEQNDNYFYYCTKSDNPKGKYEIKKINLETLEVEVLKNIDNPSKLKINSNKLIIYNDKETEEILLNDMRKDEKYYSVIFKDDDNVLDTQLVSNASEVIFPSKMQKENCVFNGWSINDDSLSTVIDNSDIGNISVNMVLSAKFNEINDKKDKKIEPSTDTISDNKHNNTYDNLSMNKYALLLTLFGSLLFYLFFGCKIWYKSLK